MLAVSLRYVEIYNEVMYDLLSPSATPAPISLIEAKDHVIPHGATEKVLQNGQHALETFFQGEASRVRNTYLPQLAWAQCILSTFQHIAKFAGDP